MDTPAFLGYHANGQKGLEGAAKRRLKHPGSRYKKAQHSAVLFFVYTECNRDVKNVTAVCEHSGRPPDDKRASSLAYTTANGYQESEAPALANMPASDSSQGVSPEQSVREISPEIRMRCEKIILRPGFLPRNADGRHKGRFADLPLKRWLAYLPSMMSAY